MVTKIAAAALFWIAFTGSAQASTVLQGPVQNPGNGHSYYLLTSDTWSASEAAAQALGGHLATIRNQAENDWIFDTFTAHGSLPRALWIGLTDQAAPGVWDASLNRSTGTFSWSSGEPVTFTDFSDSQPNNAHFTNAPVEQWVHLWPPTGQGGIYSGAPAGSWNDYHDGSSVDGAYPLFGVAEVIPKAPPLVTVDASTLSAPAGLVTARLHGLTVSFSVVFSGSTQAVLADGTYALMSYSGATVWGTFTLADGALAGVTGGLTGALSASGLSLGVDRSTLASVRVDPSPLSTNDGVLVRPGELTGGSTSATTLWLPDGTFPLTTYASTGTFGTFTVAGLAVTSTTGAVVAVQGGVSFDQARLTRVQVPASGLSTPPGHQLVRLSDVGGYSFGDATYFLPSGTWIAQGYEQGLYGTFTTAGGAVTAATGALLPASDGLAFDLSRLAAVTLPVSALSSPPGLQVARLSSLTAGEYSDTLLHLPDGTFTVMTYAGSGQFGAVVVSGGKLVSASGAMVVTPKGALAFDRCKLDNVRATAPLSFYGYLADATTYFGQGGPFRFSLAPGTYPLYDVNAGAVFGSISAAPGASVVTTDPARLAFEQLGCAPPAPVVLTRPGALDNHAVFAGTSLAAAGATLTVYDGATKVSVLAAASGSWSFDGLAAPRLLADGPHTLSFTTTVDGAESEKAAASFVLWTQPPVSVIAAPLPGAVQAGATQPLVVAPAPGQAPPAGVSVARLVYLLDGVQLYAGPPAGAPTALDLSLLLPGPHTFAVSATDSLGNVAPRLGVSFRYAPRIETLLALATRFLTPLACSPGGADDDGPSPSPGRRCLGRGQLRFLLDQLEDAAEALRPRRGHPDTDEAARHLWRFLLRLAKLSQQGRVPPAVAQLLSSDARFQLELLGGPPRRDRDDD